jgi:hypothetical protein
MDGYGDFASGIVNLSVPGYARCCGLVDRGWTRFEIEDPSVRMEI